MNRTTKYRIVVVLGRPSANTKDFFNSIKMHTYDVEVEGEPEAEEVGQDYSPDTPGRPDTNVDLSEGYAVINWHCFKEGDGWRS